MSFLALILRSLRHRWQSHLGVALGACVGGAALIGALIVGDSVRATLHRRALARLGNIHYAMAPADRFVTESLAEEMPGSFRDGWHDEGRFVWYGERPVGILRLPAMAVRQDGTARANQVSLLGVSSDPEQAQANSYAAFWWFGKADTRRLIAPGEVWLNPALAAQLNAQVGTELILRVHKPSALSRDAPITPRSDASVALRLKVAGIRTRDGMGDFSLRASQTPPLNAFVDLKSLQRATGLTNRVNTLLAFAVNWDGPSLSLRDRAESWLRTAGLDRMAGWLGLPRKEYLEYPTERALASFQNDLKLRLDLRDLQATLRPAPSNSVELVSDRIFIEPALEQAALAGRGRSAKNDSAAISPTFPPPGTNAQRILTYLANQLRLGDNATPYSMITAAGPPWTPPDLRQDEMLITDWLAEDLKAKPGDWIQMSYFVADSGTQLIERTNRFRVRAVVPLRGVHADRTLMPEFPGLAKAESTHDWDAGFPLTHKIRDKDEAYWKQHRGTPKAYITLAAGQRLWGSRFGSLTAIRWPIPSQLLNTPLETPEERAARLSGKDRPVPLRTSQDFAQSVREQILANIEPSELGLRFEPVREEALRAASQSQDFGGLFIGFSFFLILAALILVALLFQFGLEQRVIEVGTLLALGFTARQVRRLFLFEGTGLALLGGLGGTVAGLLYARLMLNGLTTVWRDAVGAAELDFHASPLTLCCGLLGAVAVSSLTLWLALRGLARQPARVLLAGETAEQRVRKRSRSGWVAACAWLGAAALVGWALQQRGSGNVEVFFGAGSLCLLGGLATVANLLVRLQRQASLRGLDPTAPSLAVLALRGCARRRRRSLSVAALLACGVFIIASIGVFRLETGQDAFKRASGTGGFALVAQSTLPVLNRLDDPAAQEALGLDPNELRGVAFVPFRVREGDDASCLNLNRAQKPRLLGVSPSQLARRGAFHFAEVESGRYLTNGWDALTRGGDEVPAIGDAASIQWALGKKIGDTLDYTDEQGRVFKLRLVGAVANSILQGSLIVSEEHFLNRFPAESGYRMFLVDAPSNRVAQVAAALSRGLGDLGLEAMPAARRLAQFNAVQNTYLSTFQVLGVLGLLLGSAGLGIVAMRNVLERRSELALLLAVGFTPRQTRRLVLVEHGLLLAVGLAVGLGAAAVAILPALRGAAESPPWRSLALTAGGVLLIGVVAAWLGTQLALRGRLVDALRHE